MSRPFLQSSLLAATLLLPACNGEPVEETTTSQSTRPSEKLMVLVVVDQMVPFQLERLEPWLDGGFGRFLQEGQVWKNAEHAHGVTQTGPGHATIATGLVPARHGVIANSWRDLEGKEWNCVTDPNVRTLTSDGVSDKGRPASGWRLRAAGISDHVRAAYPDSISVGISGKDRAAILGSAGADWALWWVTTRFEVGE